MKPSYKKTAIAFFKSLIIVGLFLLGHSLLTAPSTPLMVLGLFVICMDTVFLVHFLESLTTPNKQEPNV